MFVHLVSPDSSIERDALRLSFILDQYLSLLAKFCGLFERQAGQYCEVFEHIEG
jgi:hypothetical protein